MRPILYHMLYYRYFFLRFLLVLILCFGLSACGGGPSLPLPPSGMGSGKEIVETARALTGSPYRYGGCDPDDGFDCSGFVKWVYEYNGYSMPRSTNQLIHIGVPISSSKIHPGDLIFFNIASKGRALHVGISSGPDMFIHSPSSGGRVREDHISQVYWRTRFIGARRVIR